MHWSHFRSRSTLQLVFFLGALLCLCSFADGQGEGSVFIQGSINQNAAGLTITADADHSVLRIVNPEIFNHPEGHRVILHGTLTKEGLHAISAAAIDNSSDPLGSALVEMAAYRQDAAIVAHLLQLGANPNAKGPDGSPALIEAIETGLMRWGAPPSIEITTLLLDHGADPNVPNKDGETPLMAAAFTANDEVVRLLLDHHAKVNAKDKYGFTPLMNVQGGSVVKLLVAAGASLEDKDEDGETALLHAIRRCDSDFVKALVDSGANANAKDKEGRSALEKAKRAMSFYKGDSYTARCQLVIDILTAAGAR